MAFYEHTFITPPELNTKDLNLLKNKINEIINNNDSKILKEEDWGVRTLAYPIKKNNRGNYKNIYIEGNNKVIKDLEQFERYDDRIIKFLSIKVKKIPEENSDLTKIS